MLSKCACTACLQAVPQHAGMQYCHKLCEGLVLGWVLAPQAHIAFLLERDLPTSKLLGVCQQVATDKGRGFCKVPTPSLVLGVNACDISCKRCKPCACFDYCPFCGDAPPVSAPGATCAQLACPRSSHP